MQLSYWLKIVDNPSFKDKYSSVVLPTNNDKIIHYAVKLEDSLYVSFIFSNGIRIKIIFDIGSAIGANMHLVYQFKNDKVSNIYLNNELIEFKIIDYN